MTGDVQEIFVALRDEATENVWRPAPGREVGPGTYVILRPDDYGQDVEAWEFPPGATVVCEPRRDHARVILAAVRRAPGQPGGSKLATDGAPMNTDGRRGEAV